MVLVYRYRVKSRIVPHFAPKTAERITGCERHYRPRGARCRALAGGAAPPLATPFARNRALVRCEGRMVRRARDPHRFPGAQQRMELPLRRGALRFQGRERSDIGGIAAGGITADGQMTVRSAQGVPNGIEESRVGELEHEPVI